MHPTHTSLKPPERHIKTPHCSSAADQRLLLRSPSKQADSRQSLTRLFSAAVTADDPLDLFHGILMQFDMQRGPRRSHNTCLNTHSLAHCSSPCMLNLAPSFTAFLLRNCSFTCYVASLAVSLCFVFFFFCICVELSVFFFPPALFVLTPIPSAIPLSVLIIQ